MTQSNNLVRKSDDNDKKMRSEWNIFVTNETQTPTVGEVSHLGRQGMKPKMAVGLVILLIFAAGVLLQNFNSWQSGREVFQSLPQSPRVKSVILKRF